MTTTAPKSMSWRAARVRARAPRALLYALVTILCVAGLRAIVRSEPTPAPVQAVVDRGADLAVLSFAEGFARAYLSWDADNPDARQTQLARFLPSSMSADGGVTPAPDSSQLVAWTSVLGAKRHDDTTVVTVSAETSNGSKYLSVPIARDRRGFLSIAGYPALVGPPATNRTQADVGREPVEDRALATVAERAITNYLARAHSNLVADLAPGAIVSMPTEALKVTSAGDATWLMAGHRLALDVQAQDAEKTAWTLRYELEVVKRDRWYVRSIQVDSTFKGDS